MNQTSFKIQVECYSGYRGEETPRRFSLGERKIEISEIIDRWLGPDHRYFKVAGDDGGLYIIRYDILKDQWDLTFFKQTQQSDSWR